MIYHERTKIVIEMESANGTMGDIYIDVKCWDKNKAIKVSREETFLIISSICERALKYTKCGDMISTISKNAIVQDKDCEVAK